MANRLTQETSPYLLQHKDNPVDWYPWGEEALRKAREEDRPILLSVGYSACHWCHVMERESFEDEATARLMNEHFVNIKVDREERPDIDSIYMSAVQAMTRHGGWPMTVFMTPDGAPFYGGTYFPPVPSRGMPSFKQLLLSLADAYENRRDEVMQSAESVREYLQAATGASAPTTGLSEELLDNAATSLLGQLDNRFGGFDGAPKFPQAMNLEVLLRYYKRTGNRAARAGVEHTCRQMANGGIYDQLGGGFARYSVDEYWLVPHFEKMLYDNALLARLYLEAYQGSGDDFFRRIAEETLDYVARDMTDPEGGFYSAEDADSEGEEGKFYVWTPEEIEATLEPDEAKLAMRFWDVTERGNFEGKNILNVSRPPEAVAAEFDISAGELWHRMVRIREKLLAEREKRVRPGRDEKVLAAWNGLMLRAFAFASSVLDREDYREIAEKNASFLMEKLVVDGRLRRSYKDGRFSSGRRPRALLGCGEGCLLRHGRRPRGARHPPARRLRQRVSVGQLRRRGRVAEALRAPRARGLPGAGRGRPRGPERRGCPDPRRLRPAPLGPRLLPQHALRGRPDRGARRARNEDLAERRLLRLYAQQSRSRSLGGRRGGRRSRTAPRRAPDARGHAHRLRLRQLRLPEPDYRPGAAKETARVHMTGRFLSRAST
jgi:uncharacterized protein